MAVNTGTNWNEQELLNASFGLYGFDALTTGVNNAPTGFYWIVLVCDIESVYAATVQGNGDGLVSATRVAEARRYGVFNQVTMTSGRVLAYRVKR